MGHHLRTRLASPSSWPRRSPRGQRPEDQVTTPSPAKDALGNPAPGKDPGDWTTDARVCAEVAVTDLATPYDTPSAMNLPRVLPPS